MNLCCVITCVALWNVLLSKNEAALAEEEEDDEEQDANDANATDYADYADYAFALYDDATNALRKRKIIRRDVASSGGLRDVLRQAGTLVGAFNLKNRTTLAGVRGGAIAHPAESYAVIWFVNLNTAIAVGSTGYAFVQSLNYDLRCSIDGRPNDGVLPYTSTLRNMGYAQCALSAICFLWTLRVTMRPR